MGDNTRIKGNWISRIKLGRKKTKNCKKGLVAENEEEEEE